MNFIATQNILKQHLFITALSGSIFLFFSLSTCWAADISSKTQVLEKQMSQLAFEIEKKTSQLSAESQSIFNFDRRIADNLARQNNLVAEQAQLQESIKSLEKEKLSIQSEYESARALHAELARLYYLSTDNNYFKILLNRGNPEQAARMPVYYTYLQRAYTRSHDDLQAKTLRLNAKVIKLREQETQLVSLLASVAKNETELRNERSQRKDFMAKLDKQLSSAREQQEKLQKDHERLKQLALEMEQKAAAAAAAAARKNKASGMGFASNRDGLNWPVEGKIIGKFGQSRIRGGVKWNGILIESVFGTPVKAVANGDVVFSDWFGGYGYVLIVEHGNNFMSLYAHNQQLLKRTGDRVQAGERIAEVGNSGRSGNPALYFEIRHKGKPVNPGKWLLTRR